jgi:hypothetical protein
MRATRVLAWAIVLFGCSTERVIDPERAADGPDFMTREGCEITPGCGDDDEDVDPYAAQPGYRLASMVTPTLCFATSTAGLNGAGGGINDLDLDGVDDNCERSLAEAFRPHFVFSPYDCNIGGGPHWAAKYYPVKTGVVSKPTVRIVYMAAFYQDCGVPNLGSTFTCNFGFASEPCSGHYGDSEFVTVDVRYQPGYRHWYVAGAFLSAHYRALGGESSREVVTCVYETCTPVMYRRTMQVTSGFLFYSRVQESRRVRWVNKIGGRPVFFAANGKHGSYPDYNTCNVGGAFGHDSCEGSSLTSTGTTLFFSGNRNVGSWHRPFINRVTLPGDYFHTGTEWFWDSTKKFFGWMPQHDEQGSSPYYSFLTRRFECYALPEDRQPTEGGYCYRGMVRS